MIMSQSPRYRVNFSNIHLDDPIIQDRIKKSQSPRYRVNFSNSRAQKAVDYILNG